VIGEKNKVFIFRKLSMEKWSTQFNLKTNKGLMQFRSIKKNKGVFRVTQYHHFYSAWRLSH